MTNDRDRDGARQREDANAASVPQDRQARPSPVSSSSTTPSHLVEVTQADRDAAAPHVAGGLHWWNANRIVRGEYDNHGLVQAFARHRLSTQRSCDAEVAAWLRDQGPVTQDTLSDHVCAALETAADAIEAGKHRND